MRKYSIDELSRFIDHTNLKADAKEADMVILCQEAVAYHFKMVAINQVQSAFCARQLKDTDINVGAAIAFPLGQTTIAAKLFETENAIAGGATEIDYVINITQLKAGNYDYIRQEMEGIVRICRQHKVISKVIFENCYLTKAEIRKLSEIALEVKPDFIKTSTGFGPSGATFGDVKLMKEIVGDAVKVKAAGGIKDAATFLEMVRLGADRIGCSSGIRIIEDLKQQMLIKQVDYIEI